MQMKMWVGIALLAWPLIEIGLFVTVSGAIGLWATLAIVLATGVLGVLCMRPSLIVARAQKGVRDPRAMMMNATRGSMTMVAGVMLFLPGFLTDVLGLILLLPPVQTVVGIYLASLIRVRTDGKAKPASRDDVIEGDYVTVEPAETAQRPSKWTQD
jgi:UPF0716 protein FxsA